MVRRTTSTLFASALLIAQLLVAPFAHTETSVVPDQGCAGGGHHASLATDTVHPGCSHHPSAAGDRSGANCRHCHSHAACSCPCVHTPALSSLRALYLLPEPPSAVVGALAAPAFDPPLFEFLRPPA